MSASCPGSGGRPLPVALPPVPPPRPPAGPGRGAGSLAGSTAAAPSRPGESPADAPLAPRGLPAALRDVAVLAKLRVNALVLATTAAGFVLALPRGVAVDGALLGWTLLGTGLLACGASALNQAIEARWDARMARTENRPLAAGRASAAGVAAAASCGVTAGVALLALRAGPVPAVLGGVTAIVYLGLYTPLKRRTPAALLVGAVAGALPPVLGWTAAGAGPGSGAYLLFAVLFLWQVPHFHAIAWLYRADYAAGGYRLLAVVRPDGRAVAVEVLASTGLLVAASVAPACLGLVPGWMGAVAGGLGGLFALCGAGFAASRGRAAARALLHGSLLYLPALLGVWIVAAA